ncbi:SDR family oxidoreductase, partial [Klebsiella pneumoniae]
KDGRRKLLRLNVTIEEVGNAGAFLCSDLASGISGEILYVDGGFNTTALGLLDDDWSPRPCKMAASTHRVYAS